MFGPHLTLDLSECDPRKLSDLSHIYDLLDELPDVIGMHKITPPYTFIYRPPSPENLKNVDPRDADPTRIRGAEKSFSPTSSFLFLLSLLQIVIFLFTANYSFSLIYYVTPRGGIRKLQKPFTLSVQSNVLAPGVG